MVMAALGFEKNASVLNCGSDNMMSRKTATKKHRNLTNNAKNRELCSRIKLKFKFGDSEEKRKSRFELPSVNVYVLCL